MTRPQKERELIRRFLLGDLGDERREEVEERLLTDRELHEELSVARDELIDEYVFGLLDARELKLFEDNFQLTPERLHELRLSRALRKYVGAEAAGAAASARGFRLFHNRRAWMAAAAALVLALGGWALYRYQQRQAQLEQAMERRLRIEQELALLNQRAAPDRADNQPSVVRLTLSSGLTRGGGDERRALVDDGKEILLLNLRLDEDTSESYRAVIETDDGADIYTVGNLKKSVTGGGASVRLLLPIRLLPTGDYQIRLISNAGTSNAEAGTYPFQVVLR